MSAPESNLDLIKLYLKTRNTTVWGRGFDLHNSMEDAATWFDTEMDNYFEWLEGYYLSTVVNKTKLGNV